MLANLTLADAQLQIGATIVLLLMAYGLGWLSARAKDWLQRELLEAGMDLPPAQMTPFRGPLAYDIPPLSEPPEMSLGEILEVAGYPSIDRIVGATNRHVRAARENPPTIDDQPSTIDDLYTEHSPQIPELRKPAGPFGDDWRGGEYGGSVDMLRRVAKEKEVED